MKRYAIKIAVSLVKSRLDSSRFKFGAAKSRLGSTGKPSGIAPLASALFRFLAQTGSNAIFSGERLKFVA